MDEHPFAISGIKEPEKIRILIYANNQMAHVALSALLMPLQNKMTELENRLKKLGV
ncbi:hypothetical protein H3S80_08535 [Bartonella sp. M0177]|uniref:hypothetical protein n=1 Tax=Bartonella sp. M0177 TaxID=2750940 RepID=UPI0018DCA6CD|nr:hypothetical protein [Bartonella sp. M0177]MBI0004093.1 hypothetical protein [Bartonella sp. M0177]